jgi:secondary thiamine-phosphate synthase enzyme
MTYQETLRFHTNGRGTYDISSEIAATVHDAGIESGICHIFVQHTSASLILCENADPDVRSDLERFMISLVPDGAPMFRHIDEGEDDMPAHVRSILTNMDLTIPVSNGNPALGIWQGIYLYEHRSRAHQRRIVVTITQ